MDIHETLAALTRHAVFKEWQPKNKDYFLAHAFLMLDEANKNTWQIGFYNAGKERMVTFIVSGNSVERTDEQEVLKKEGEIQPLKLEEVKLSVEEALKISKECFEEKYSAEKTLKQFFIIQNLEGHHMFNITYFTQSFQTINIKLDAKTGKVLKQSIQKLAQFG